MQSIVCRIWEWLSSASPAPLVTIEVAIVGLIVSWWQLRYMKRRDRETDIRNDWTETHKAMITFRFKRELLNLPDLVYPRSAEFAVAAQESLHILKSQLDRMPDGPLVEQMASFLHTNCEPEMWRSPAFQEQFDQYAKQVASLTH
jgi:hypothetical protein